MVFKLPILLWKPTIFKSCVLPFLLSWSLCQETVLVFCNFILMCVVWFFFICSVEYYKPIQSENSRAYVYGKLFILSSFLFLLLNSLLHFLWVWFLQFLFIEYFIGVNLQFFFLLFSSTFCICVFILLSFLFLRFLWCDLLILFCIFHYRIVVVFYKYLVVVNSILCFFPLRDVIFLWSPWRY